jgi:hypothetical protein
MEAEIMTEKLKQRKDSIVRSRHWYRSRLETFSEYLEDLQLFWASEKGTTQCTCDALGAFHE